MTTGGNYSTPVTVNGFLCRNCTEVGYAKKHIDPAHPKSGPYGVDAKADPTAKKAPSPDVVFGGSLAGIVTKPTAATPDGRAEPSLATAGRLDVFA